MVTDDQENLKNQLSAHLCSPVRWDIGISYLIENGVNKFIEIGYGTLLTKFGYFINRQVMHTYFYNNSSLELSIGENECVV